MPPSDAQDWKQSGASVSRQADLGALLRAARVRAELSQADLARKLGVSQETVSAAELGRAPRHTTLMAYLEALPWLSAHDILPRPTVPRAASPAAWRRLRDVFGFSAKLTRVAFELSASGGKRSVRVEGVVAPFVDFSAPVCLALMRAVAVAESRSLVELELPERLPTARRPLRFQDSRGAHRLWTEPEGTAVTVVYEMDGPLDEFEPTSHAVEYVTETLELVIRSHDPDDLDHVDAWVRPSTIPREDAGPALMRLMHPRSADVRAEDGGIVCRIAKPLPGFVYGLTRGEGQVVRPSARRWSLAGTLRRSREEAGLSLRDVAARAGVCHASVAYAEAGRDPRLGTLRGYLDAIPSLSPQDLLPATCASGTLSDAETWDLCRDLYGYEIREIRKTVTIKADGTSTNEIETIGLRPLRADLREMRVQTGLHRAVAQVSERVLRELASDLRDLRVRQIRKVDGTTVHEFRFPTRLATGALSHVRRYAGPRYPLHRGASRKHLDPGDEVYSGAGLTIHHPTRRVTLQVFLPSGIATPWVRASVWPASVGPDSDLPPLSRELPQPPCRVTTSRRGTKLSVSVTAPIIGTCLALTWGVGERYAPGTCRASRATCGPS